MPELPEVETTILELKPKVLQRTFVDVWSDIKKNIRCFPSKNKGQKESRSHQGGFQAFKKNVVGKQVKEVRRRGKNILFDLSKGKTLLIHQKMTGHLLVGKWKKEQGRWISEVPGPLEQDPQNKYIHLIFFLDNSDQIALSDLRKFSKIELWEKERLVKSPQMREMGPEPLNKNFDFQKFKQALYKRRRGEIKKVLMDQRVVAGVGNIYANEILWEAEVNPFRDFKKLDKEELERIYRALRKVLKKAVKMKGSSVADFRRASGKKGKFQRILKAYQREGLKCQRCGEVIKRKKIGGRSTFFCSNCQS